MADIKFTDSDELGEKYSTLGNVVEKTESELKDYMISYVGNKLDPEDDNVTVGMVVNTVAAEFPEFLLAVAEENWIRGYQQALSDVDEGKRLIETEKKRIEEEKSE
tara:strand:- start:255 stop:572 length:318 start_codon:yes stop_codon:yes gene_type:complete